MIQCKIVYGLRKYIQIIINVIKVNALIEKS